MGLAAGLDAIGVAPASAFDDTRRHLEERRRAGLHGGMAFTYRNPARSTDPDRILSGARAIVVGARRYPSRRRAGSAPDAGAPNTRSDGGGAPGACSAEGGETARPVGAVARYASADYYRPLRQALEAVAGRLRADGFGARVVADDNALVDRAAAHRAGLGWYGKNTNLLLPGQGSWFVLGSVVTDAPLPTAAAPLADGCGSCRRCLPACPTGALVAPGVLDARRCLAWLVQAPGIFPVEYRAALGGRLYGCDDCQEVCPENLAADRAEAGAGAARFARAADRAEAGAGAARFARAADRAEAGAGAARFAREDGSDADRGSSFVPGTADHPSVDLLALLAADDADLMACFGRWYIPRRQPRYLRRNALLALGNTADGRDPAVEAALRRALADPDPIIRGHAVWAAARLGRADLIAPLAGDDDEAVRQEVAWAVGDLT